MNTRLAPRRTTALAGLAAAAALGLSACGGGGGDSADSSTPAATPLADNSTTATALATETRRALSLTQQAAALPRISVSNMLRLAVSQTGTLACDYGGTWGHNSGAVLQINTPYVISFNACSFQPGWVYQGSITATYTLFTPPATAAWTAAYDLTLTGSANGAQRVAGTMDCSYNGGALACSVSDGQRTYDRQITVGSTLNGSYVWRYDSATPVTLNFTNWNDSSGRANVSAPGGLQAVVERLGPDSFRVTVNGGTPYTVTVTG